MRNLAIALVASVIAVACGGGDHESTAAAADNAALAESLTLQVNAGAMQLPANTAPENIVFNVAPVDGNGRTRVNIAAILRDDTCGGMPCDGDGGGGGTTAGVPSGTGPAIGGGTVKPNYACGTSYTLNMPGYNLCCWDTSGGGRACQYVKIPTSPLTTKPGEAGK